MIEYGNSLPMRVRRDTALHEACTGGSASQLILGSGSPNIAASRTFPLGRKLRLQHTPQVAARGFQFQKQGGNVI